MRQVVDLHERGIPMTLGSGADLDRYRELVAAARRAQTAPFIVAPRCTVRTLDGLLAEGAEVRADQLVPEVDAAGHRTSGPMLLHALVRRGVVLSIEDRV